MTIHYLLTHGLPILVLLAIAWGIRHCSQAVTQIREELTRFRAQAEQATTPAMLVCIDKALVDFILGLDASPLQSLLRTEDIWARHFRDQANDLLAFIDGKRRQLLQTP